MNRDQKAAVVEELAEQIRSADAIFAVDYRGISVAQAADLRTKLYDAQTRFRIVKNSLTERATDEAGADSLKPMLEGPTALAFVAGDAALAAKALSDAGRALGTLEFKGGVMNGATLSAEDIRSIARLPSRDVLNSQLVGTVAAPLSGLVRGLNALIAGLAVQLQQIADEGLVSGPEPSPVSEAAPEVVSEAAPSSVSEARAGSGTDTEAAASTRPAADTDEAAPEVEAEATPEAEAEAEVEVAPEAADEAPAEPEPEAPAEVPQEDSETETEAASDAESSEA